MPLFKRRRPDPPEWAGFLDADGWHAFSELVRYETDRRGWPLDLALGITVHAGATMHLTNLAQMCLGEPREEWTEIVARHFVTLDEAGKASFDSAEEARAALRVRLIDAAFVAARAIPMASRRVGDDLDLALAYDLPDTIQLPSREDVLEWGDEDELFELALEQTRAEPDLELVRDDYGEEQGIEPTSLWLLSGDSFFTASHGLWADEFDPPASEHGTLVSIPNRHVVLAHPIRDFSVISAVQVMLNVGHGLWVEGPGSLSDGLYWLRDGYLQRIETHVEDDHTVFAPPDELVEIMNGFE